MFEVEEKKQVKKKEEPEKLVWKGVEYDPAFGKIIRALDREQAQINENKRRAYWRAREQQLEPVYEK